MESLHPPDAFKFEGNLIANWFNWRQSFEYFLTATEAELKAEKVKTSMLLTCIGKEGRKIYKTFDFEDEYDAKNNLETVLEKFTLYIESRTSIVVSRYNFYTHRQGEGQLFMEFVKELKDLCEECDFVDSDAAMRDMIVCGVYDSSVRHKMFSVANLDLIKAMDIGLHYDRVEKKKRRKRINKRVVIEESSSETVMTQTITKKTSKMTATATEEEEEEEELKSISQNEQDVDEEEELKSISQNEEEMELKGISQNEEEEEAAQNSPKFESDSLEQSTNSNFSSSSSTATTVQENVYVKSTTRRLKEENDSKQTTKVGLIQNCKCCGNTHPVRKCPAYGRRCNTCKQANHVTRYCPMRRKNVVEHFSDSCTSVTKPIARPPSKYEVFHIENNLIQHEKFSTSCANETINRSISIDSQDAKSLKPQFSQSICLETNGTPIKFTIDSHAQVNILPRHLYDRLQTTQPSALNPSPLSVSAFDKTELQVDGKCILPVLYKNRIHHILFIVVNTKTTPIFTLDTFERLDLMRGRSSKSKRRRSWSLVKQYIDVFNDIIRINRNYHVSVKDNTKPVVKITRHVKKTLERKLKDKLKIMEGLGIVEKLKKAHGDWVNELVCIEKAEGDISVTIDPRPINKAIRRKKHPSQTVAEAIKKSSGANLYTRLVGANTTWQIELDDKSANLLTFSTQFGIFRFKKLPLGIHTADNIFEAEVTKLLRCMDEVANIQNDILIWGETKESHDTNLTNVLTCLRKSGFKLDYEKCIFAQRKLPYHGHIMSADGVKPDMRKVKAIIDLPVPVNRLELYLFVDLVNYTGKLVPNLPSELEPMKALLSGNEAFKMTPQHVDTFSRLKTLVTSSIVFLIFDPNLPTLIQTDSSAEGLGAMLEQFSENQWFPIAFASRALQADELKYTQDEREYLSLLFGCESFHDYVSGRRIFLQNNYDGLNRIYSGPIGDYTKNLQHIYLKLLRYNVTLIEGSGQKLVVPEALCKAYLKNHGEEESDQSLETEDDVEEIPEDSAADIIEIKAEKNSSHTESHSESHHSESHHSKSSAMSMVEYVDLTARS